MSKWLIALPMLFATAAAAVPVWTWVDENGRQHYSDRPVPGARQIDLPTAQGFSQISPPAQGTTTQAQNAVNNPPALRYQAFGIQSPAQQQTLWNIGGNLDMQVELTPALQAGHRFDVFLDGERVPIGATTTGWTVPNVFRGLHTLQAVIMDASGREILRTDAITIMVQQTSIQN
jgi:hypothetical protein